ncbi:hypothetical protein RvY_07855 [Ramazzottius varieornatus]|uniref:Uncharacterized protein n=1 Tax=Ramazzottius varieornatus TaxID=947166 RepID=A0A1D1VBZ6_RAMVA|nr:hypothetical protein RvY_07855 [Ramazzottius varieornatus]
MLVLHCVCMEKTGRSSDGAETELPRPQKVGVHHSPHTFEMEIKYRTHQKLYSTLRTRSTANKAFRASFHPRCSPLSISTLHSLQQCSAGKLFPTVSRTACGSPNSAC